MINGFAHRFKSWYALPVSAERLVLLMLSSTLTHHRDVIEFCVPDKLARAALKNLPSVTLSQEEVNFLVGHVPTRHSANTKAAKLISDELFKERAEKIEHALSCTIAESASKALWNTALVKLSCVLAFQFSHSPVECLEKIFGSLVRSDLRRCDDLHEKESTDPMDIVLLGEILECTSHALVC